MDNAQLINQTSGITEYYTPPEVTEAARATMVAIDYDPASSERANGIVRARFYTTAPQRLFVSSPGALPTMFTDRGGLDTEWTGRVFMNHPFGAYEKKCSSTCTKKICTKRGYHLGQPNPGNGAWIDKLVSSYEYGEVAEAIMICFASTSEAWARPLLNYHICLLHGRTRYIDPVTMDPTGSSTKGSMVVYLGDHPEAFANNFHNLGSCFAPMRMSL